MSGKKAKESRKIVLSAKQKKSEMSRKKKYFLAGAALIIVVLCIIVPSLLDSRKQIYNEYLDAAEEISVKTGNQQAKNIVSYLKKFGAVCSQEEALRLRQQDKKIMPIAVILKEDAMSSVNQAQSELGAQAFFDYANQVIKMKEANEISLLFRGLLLLHEGKHAKNFRDSPYDADNFDARVHDEYLTYVFINELLGALGGPKYYSLLDSAVARMMLQKDTPEFPGNAVLPMLSSPYDPGLDYVFGPAQTDADKQNRQSGLALHACFTLFDRAYPDKEQASRQKEKLIGYLYEPVFRHPKH